MTQKWPVARFSLFPRPYRFEVQKRIQDSLMAAKAPRKIEKMALGEMRASGVRGLLIYCADYRCSHSVEMSGDRWADDVRLT